MSSVSSQDLHPKAGARFVFEREGEALRYAMHVYLPEGVELRGHCAWDADGKAEIEFDTPPSDDAAWVVDGAAKLARVLKRDPKSRLVRWRDR